MTAFLLFMISIPRGNWFRINYLGLEVGYHRFRTSVMEVAYGSTSRGIGIGGAVFEYDHPTWLFLPVTIYLARPFGRDSGPIEGKFGGPVLFPWGYQYPAAVYLFARACPLGLRSGEWCLTSNLGIGFAKEFFGFGTVGLDLGYAISLQPGSETVDEGLFGAVFYNFAAWAKAEKE